MKKRLIAVLVLLVLVSSNFIIAQEKDNSQDTGTPPETVSEPQTVSEADSCGFWCKVSQFLFGSAENRAGKGWFDRKEALVGNE